MHLFLHISVAVATVALNTLYSYQCIKVPIWGALGRNIVAHKDNLPKDGIVRFADFP